MDLYRCQIILLVKCHLYHDDRLTIAIGKHLCDSVPTTRSSFFHLCHGFLLTMPTVRISPSVRIYYYILPSDPLSTVYSLV